MTTRQLITRKPTEAGEESVARSCLIAVNECLGLGFDDRFFVVVFVGRRSVIVVVFVIFVAEVSEIHGRARATTTLERDA